MTLFTIFLLVWYGWQFIEAWIYAGAGEYESGKPVTTLIGVIGCSFLLFSVFYQTDGPLTWQGWALVAYYLVNIGMGLQMLVRGPKVAKWSGAEAFVVSLLMANILALWYTGVL